MVRFPWEIHNGRERVWEGPLEDLPHFVRQWINTHKPDLRTFPGKVTLCARKRTGEPWAVRWSWLPANSSPADRLRHTRRKGAPLPQNLSDRERWLPALSPGRERHFT